MRISFCRTFNRQRGANDDGSDLWAIGVITYFLLCGYTPFDRDSNLEEMQAILVADYSFTPVEYWRGVSNQGMDTFPIHLSISVASWTMLTTACPDQHVSSSGNA